MLKSSSYLRVSNLNTLNFMPMRCIRARKSSLWKQSEWRLKNAQQTRSGTGRHGVASFSAGGRTRHDEPQSETTSEGPTPGEILGRARTYAGERCFRSSPSIRRFPALRDRSRAPPQSRPASGLSIGVEVLGATRASIRRPIRSCGSRRRRGRALTRYYARDRVRAMPS